MADRTSIEWTDATWNPNRGCSRVSQGCVNCYAEVMAARFSDPGQWGHSLAQRVTLANGQTDHRWTGKVAMIEDQLDQPLRWKRPRKIFVNSTSDLFHQAVPDEWIDRVFAVMALCPQRTFQLLTKRPERMQAYLSGLGDAGRMDITVRGDGRLLRAAEVTARNVPRITFDFNDRWPLRNLWIGTSVEDQSAANERIPYLLNTPAAVRFLSVEPMLGPVDLTLDGLSCGPCPNCADASVDPETGMVDCGRCHGTGKGDDVLLDWVICGGESGPGARVWDGFEDAARSLRDQCRSAGVAFFMKQMAGPRKAAMPPIPADLLIREIPRLSHG